MEKIALEKLKELRNRIIELYFEKYGKSGFGSKNNKLTKDFIRSYFKREIKEMAEELKEVIKEKNLHEGLIFIKKCYFIWTTIHELFYKEIHDHSKKKEYKINNEFIKAVLTFRKEIAYENFYQKPFQEGETLYDFNYLKEMLEKYRKTLLLSLIDFMFLYSPCSINEGPIIKKVELEEENSVIKPKKLEIYDFRKDLKQKIQTTINTFL